MALESSNVVFIDKGVDEDGYQCDILECPLTGTRYKAYSVEDWWNKCERQTRRASSGQHRPAVSDGGEREVVHENRTSHASAARRGH